MVSRGWPAITVHTPPNPPLKKYLIGLTVSDMIIVYKTESLNKSIDEKTVLKNSLIKLRVKVQQQLALDVGSKS